ncbi:MAG: PAS domain-containing sensor histidine kinase [Kangiellaceae bacterium]|jgi:PAS domain S-box-containing protein|nr:PAS domain-containing sensor histidine kinase [Kangiellaceae bacterium]
MNRFEDILSRIPQLFVVVYHFHKKEFTLNHNAHRIIGLPSKEVYTFEEGIKLIHPDDLQRVKQFLEGVLKKNETSEMKHRIKLPSGVVKHVHSSFLTLFNEGGEPEEVCAIVRDISTEVESRRQLEIVNDILKERNEYFKSVIHDLKAPIANIEMILELLNLDVKLDSIEDQEVLATLYKSVAQAKNTIQELNNIGPTSKHSETFRLEKVNISDFLYKELPLLKTLTFRKQINLSLVIEQNFAFFANPLSLNRILTNLVNNAVKFSYPERTIQIIAKATKYHGFISVIDEGIGIPNDLLPYLFDRNVTKKNRPGTQGEHSSGLGLSITKQLVEMHNGSINVKSTVGKGSEFIIKLPICSTI